MLTSRRQIYVLLGLSFLSSTFIIFKRQKELISAQPDPTETLPHFDHRIHLVKEASFGTAAMCVLAKHEELYLDEFVDYHLALGFSNIFIYDNSEEFGMKPWAEKRRPAVRAIHFPGAAMQMRAYQECARTVASNHTWIAYFDIDEFLVLKKHNTVTEFLNEYLPKGALAINWRVFGTGNHREYQPQPVTLRFKFRLFDNELMNKHVKIVVRKDDLSLKRPMPTPHNVILKDNMVTVSTNGEVVTGPFNENADYSVAALHHYHFKSYKEYITKRMRGRGDISEVDQRLVKLAKEGQNPPGSVFDDSAWQKLKLIAPAYRAYEKTEKTS